MVAGGAVRTMAAVDLGAESGRVMVARYDGQRLSLDEVHRFPNRAVMVRGHRLWNILGLWDEVLTGLRAARQGAGSFESVGVDAWGVDYGLVNSQGLLRALPFHYRDLRTGGVVRAFSFCRSTRSSNCTRTSANSPASLAGPIACCLSLICSTAGSAGRWSASVPTPPPRNAGIQLLGAGRQTSSMS